jgi:glycosyltransferase involved in cell wall biosynthesis
MRFGINAISVMTGGNVTYFANILQEMAQLLEARGDTLFVYTRKDGRVTVPGSPALREMPIAPQGLSAGRRVAWEQVFLPIAAERDQLDVFFGPGDNVPLAMRCRTVCAFRNPNVYTPFHELPWRTRPRLAGLRALALATARKCERAIFVSATARDAIMPVIGLEPERARVVYHGLGDVFRGSLEGPTPWARPYLLTVSTLYHYKNFPRLIQAYDKYVKQAGLPHGLVIIGGVVDPKHFEEIQSAVRARGLENDVRLEGEVRYPAVGPWYRHASAFVFPSYRETFGHPLLEAMAADLPLAAADIAVMREIGGDVPVYFDPFSIDAMGQALQNVLSGNDRDERIRRGRERLKQFSWKQTAELTLKVLDEAASAPKRDE